MIDLKVDLSPLDEFAKRIAQKSSKLNQDIYAALNNWASDTMIVARQNHRFQRKTGRLEDSVRKKMSAGKSPKVYLSLDESVANYAKFIHDGTTGGKPIVPKSKKALRWAGGGGFFYSKKVISGSIKKDPFLEKAIESKKAALSIEMMSAVKKGLV